VPCAAPEQLSHPESPGRGPETRGRAGAGGAARIPPLARTLCALSAPALGALAAGVLLPQSCGPCVRPFALPMTAI